MAVPVGESRSYRSATTVSLNSNPVRELRPVSHRDLARQHTNLRAGFGEHKKKQRGKKQ
jgi:hypothetical protein